MIDISVIIPLYKCESYMKKLIDNINRMFSVADEAGINCEAIFVNDYPDSDMIIESNLGFNYRVINNSKNLGIHRSRVIGVEASSGENVLLIDQDDLFEDDILVSQFKCLKEADGVVCNAVWYDEIYDYYRRQYGLIIPSDRINNLEEMVEIEDAIISPGQVLIKKDKIPQEWLDISLDFQGCDDYLLWIIMLSKGARFNYNDRILYTHVNHYYNASKNIIEMFNSQKEILTLSFYNGFISEKQYRKRIDSDNIKRRELSIKYQEIAELNSLWMSKLFQGATIDCFLTKRGIEDVIIYGWGILGRELFLQLYNSELISVKCVVDKNASDYKGKVGFVTIDEALNMEYKKDRTIIVVTVLGITEKLCYQMKNRYGFNSISIHELISNL